jgi:hypothetical protein
MPIEVGAVQTTAGDDKIWMCYDLLRHFLRVLQLCRFLVAICPV